MDERERKTRAILRVRQEMREIFGMPPDWWFVFSEPDVAFYEDFLRYQKAQSERADVLGNSRIRRRQKKTRREE
jgi:hypothetical protein